MNLLTVLPFWTDDAPRAEALCDFIFQLNNRSAVGHVLLLPAFDVHDEMVAKVELAAKLAFETVDLFRPESYSAANKAERINRLFAFGASTAATRYKCPWLWLEPDCTPTRPSWLDELSKAYDSQPKRYLGTHMMFKGRDNKPDVRFFAHVGIYPRDSIADLGQFITKGEDFAVASASTILPRSARTRLIDVRPILSPDDAEKIPESAVLVHGDRQSIALNMVRVQVRGLGSVPITPTSPAAPQKSSKVPVTRK